MNRSRWVVIGLLVVLAPASARTLTYPDLLRQFTDLERLTQLQAGVTSHQASSYDRAEDVRWGTNGDSGNYLRVEPNGEAVMLDTAGPGCLFRIWSANPQGRLRIYLDGAATPSYEWDFDGLFKGATPPFVKPLVYQRDPQGSRSASDCYFPIPFRRHLKVTADQAHRQYYLLNYLRYPADWTVPTFRLPLAADEEAALAAVVDAWSHPGRDPKPRLPRQTILTRTITVPAGRTVTLADLTGPGQVRAIRASVATTGRDPWRKLVLRGSWDNATWPQVLSPLGPLFGFDWQTASYGSVPAGCLDGTGYLFFPMPFRSSAKLSLQSFLSQPATVTYSLDWAPTEVPAETCYFYARWRSETDSPTFDYPLLETAGRGHLVGVSLQVHHPLPGWWGEGDEKVWVDDDQFPPWIGTGSEDYFGDAWGIRYLPGPSFGCSLQQGSQTCCYRWHLLDLIPFTKRLRMSIENYGPNGRWGNAPEYQYSSVAYWYQAELTPPLAQLAGATYLGSPVPGVAPSRQRYRTDLFRDLTDANVRTLGLAEVATQEAESLLGLAVAAGRARLIDDGDRPSRFSGEWAIDLGQVAAGQELAELRLRVRQPGVHSVNLLTTSEPGAAELTLEVNGRRLAAQGRPKPYLTALDGLLVPAEGLTARLVAVTAGQAILDAVQLLPTARVADVMEAEEQTVLAATGGGDAPHPSDPLRGPSAGRILEWHAGGVGAAVQLQLAEPARGPYVLGLRPMHGPGAGILQAFVNGQAIGPAFDLYAPAKQPGQHVLPLGPVPAGTRTVELRMVGRNPASTATHAGLDYFRWEPEILHPDSAPGVWATVSRVERCEYRIQTLGAGWSGGHHLWVQPAQEKAALDLTLHVPAAGRYRLGVRYTTSRDYAIIQPSLDGRDLGPATDTWTAPVLLGPPVDLGVVDLTAGAHVLRFRAVGRNPRSTGYLMGIDHLLVQAVG